MLKNPRADLKYQYRRTLEASASISLAIIIILFVTSKKFETAVNMRALEAPPIQVEDIPITRTIKKFEVPRKPTIPIEDPDTDMEDDIDIPDIDIFDPTLNPPPPPPTMEQIEVVDFVKVEIKPTLIGGDQAIAEYIYKNNLYPKTAQQAGVSGLTLIEFIVDVDGMPKDVQVVQEKPPGLEFGKSGVEVMKAMRFTPGMQRDRKVPVRMRQTIRYTID